MLEIRRQAITIKELIPNFNRPPINQSNPVRHRHIQNEKTLALFTINKIIHHDLSKYTRNFFSLSYWQAIEKPQDLLPQAL